MSQIYEIILLLVYYFQKTFKYLWDANHEYRMALSIFHKEYLLLN